MANISSMESFEWDENKNRENQTKHGVSFEEAQYVFADPQIMVLEDALHSNQGETRYFCVGRVKSGVLTVRFTYRANRIRIFGAGYWRKYRTLYLEQGGA